MTNLDILGIANAYFISILYIALSYLAIVLSRRLAKKVQHIFILLLALLSVSLFAELAIKIDLLVQLIVPINELNALAMILMLGIMDQYEEVYSKYEIEGNDAPRKRALLPLCIVGIVALFVSEGVIPWTVLRWINLAIASLFILGGLARYSGKEHTATYKFLSFVTDISISGVFLLLYFVMDSWVRIGVIEQQLDKILSVDTIWNSTFGGIPQIVFLLSAVILIFRAFQNSESQKVLQPITIDTRKLGSDSFAPKSLSNRQFIKGMQRCLKKIQHVDISEVRTKLETIEQAIKAPLLVTVIGEFSSGKSTFINALLNQDLLATSIRPTTATITVMHYGYDKDIKIEYLNGIVDSYSRDRLEEFTASKYVDEKTITKEVFKVDIDLSHNLLKRMDVADTPGFNSGYSHHSEITATFLQRADIIFWVLDPLQVDKKSTQELMVKHKTYLKPYAIVNKMDQLLAQVDDLQEVDKHVQFVKEELKDIFEGIFFVSAKEDLKSNSSRSGMDKVREYIEEYLIPKASSLKGQVVQSKLMTVTEDVSHLIKEYITQYTKYDERLTTYRNLNNAINEMIRDHRLSNDNLKADIAAFNSGKLTIVSLLGYLKRYFINVTIPSSLAEKVGDYKDRYLILLREVDRLNARLSNLNSRQSVLEREFTQLTFLWDKYSNKGFGLKKLADDWLGWGTKERQNLNVRSAQWDRQHNAINMEFNAHNQKVNTLNTSLIDMHTASLRLINNDLINAVNTTSEKINARIQRKKEVYTFLRDHKSRYMKIVSEMEYFCNSVMNLFRGLQLSQHTTPSMNIQESKSVNDILNQFRSISEQYTSNFAGKEIYTQEGISEDLACVKTRIIASESTLASTGKQYRAGESAPKFR